MPKLVKQKNINLIPQDEFEASTLGRILKWALSSFRIMVIATELIVMSAFLSRFWLDARNSDLNEEIEINKAQVGAYADIESEFRNNQKKLLIAKNIFIKKVPSETMKILVNLIPQDISFDSISLVNELLQIKASSLSENSIAQLLVNLEQNNNFTDISLTQASASIENSNLISFTVLGKIK